MEVLIRSLLGVSAVVILLLLGPLVKALLPLGQPIWERCKRWLLEPDKIVAACPPVSQGVWLPER